MRLTPSCFGDVKVQILAPPKKQRKPRKKKVTKVKKNVEGGVSKKRKRTTKPIKSKNNQSGQAK